jgi:hypothetical protein
VPDTFGTTADGLIVDNFAVGLDFDYAKRLPQFALSKD